MSGSARCVARQINIEMLAVVLVVGVVIVVARVVLEAVVMVVAAIAVFVVVAAVGSSQQWQFVQRKLTFCDSPTEFAFVVFKTTTTTALAS